MNSKRPWQHGPLRKEPSMSRAAKRPRREWQQWRTYIDFKISYYSSLSYLHMGMCSEEGGRWGERVAFYTAASNSLAAALRSAAG